MCNYQVTNGAAESHILEAVTNILAPLKLSHLTVQVGSCLPCFSQCVVQCILFE
jgi:hypothetical protein